MKTAWLPAVTVLFVISFARGADETIEVGSPGGNVRVTITVDSTRLKYAVDFRKAPIVETSSMDFTLDAADLMKNLEAAAPERYRLSETYPTRGVHAVATNHFGGLRLPLWHAGSGTRLVLEVRAFEDGAAFRFIVPPDEQEPDRPRVPDEATTFVLPAGSTVWYHDLQGHYEAVYAKKDVGQIRAGEWAAPPVTFKLPKGGGYASITEAALRNYSGMALQADGSRGLAIALGHRHPLNRHAAPPP